MRHKIKKGKLKFDLKPLLFYSYLKAIRNYKFGTSDFKSSLVDFFEKFPKLICEMSKRR